MIQFLNNNFPKNLNHHLGSKLHHNSSSPPINSNKSAQQRGRNNRGSRKGTKMNESGKDRREERGTVSRCEEFDSVRVEGAGREIGGFIRDEEGRGGRGGRAGGGREREICSMRERTKLPMAINFATGRGRGRRGERSAART